MTKWNLLCGRMSYLLIFLFMMLLSPQTASAHASFIEASPPPDSHLDVSPSDIILTFNERLEKELFYIRVYDSGGKSVTSSPTEMSPDQTQIRVKLPPLHQGVYSVTYHIISADGHPVEQTYILNVGNTVGQPNELTSDQSQGHHHGGFALWVDRTLYYFSLLGITGLIFWGMICSFPPAPIRKDYHFWLKTFKIFYLIMLTGVGVVQMSDVVSGTGISGIQAGILGTTFGRTWLSSFILSAIGFFLLNRWKWFDGLWLSSLWIAEAINGHAITLQPQVYSVILDIVHLGAASVWIGGLLLLLIMWKKEKDWAKQFVTLFSRTSLGCIVLLSSTGALLTLVFTSRWIDLVVTLWGILLLVKILLLGFVVLSAVKLRKAARTMQFGSFREWLKKEFALLLIIVFIVGELTYTSPTPENRPFLWHDHKMSLTITTTIQPYNPGVENSFTVQAETTNKKSKPRSVEMRLVYLGKPSLGPIKVPLQSEPVQGDQVLYSGRGAYLPMPGKWRVEIQVIDENDEETDFAKEMTLYQADR